MIRSRSVAFDAASALRAVVAAESLTLAEPGSRVVVPQRGDLSLTLFDGRILPFEVTEVAVTLEAEPTGNRPMVEAIGRHVVGGKSVAAGSFTFIADAAGEYQLSGGVDPGGDALRVEIRQGGPAVAELVEMDPASQTDEGDDADVSPASPGDALNEAGPSAAAASDAGVTPADAGAIPVVDIVVGYVRSLGSGVVTEIARRIAETNDAFARSQANVRLALVSVIPVDYIQDPTSLSEDLKWLRNGVFGLGALQDRRTQLNADLAALIVPQATASMCGLGHVPYASGDRRYGDSVTAFTCFNGYSLSHEIGHNLGGNHDRENRGEVVDIPFSFSYGHRIPGVIASVMAYTNCTPYCPRTLQFSNPDVAFVPQPSQPSGTPTEHNARSLSLLAPVISAYRDATPITRVAGADRFETAVAISQHGYPNASDVDTVLVATGLEFPDALSSAPLAAKLGAPLLLTMPGDLPAVTSAEIARLNPSKIVLVGGPNVVADAVESQLRRLAPASGAVQRIWGSDRYDTSLAVVKYGWSSTDTAFLATGSGFADALSAGAAAGMRGAPVILVPGDRAKVHEPVAAYLAGAQARTVYIAGGPASVSAGIEDDLRARTYAVTRYGGSDRFTTSTLIARAHHTVGGGMYLASASSFPDALAGAAVAGRKKAPLILSAPGCMLEDIYGVRAVVKPTSILVLGGLALLSPAVEQGRVCI